MVVRGRGRLVVGEDGVRTVDGAADVDDGLEVGDGLGVLDEANGESRGVGVGDGGFDDGIDVSEVCSQNSLVENREAPNSKTSGCWDGQHGVGARSDVGSSPSKINSERELEGDGIGEDGGFKVGNPSVTVVLDVAGDWFAVGDELGVEFGGAVGVAVEDFVLEREGNHTRSASQGAAEGRGRVRRKSLSSEKNPIVARHRSRRRGRRRIRKGERRRRRRGRKKGIQGFRKRGAGKSRSDWQHVKKEVAKHPLIQDRIEGESCGCCGEDGGERHG